MEMGSICDMCKSFPSQEMVSLVSVLHVCRKCHRQMFEEGEEMEWDRLEGWAQSHDDDPARERDTWRKFVARFRSKIAAGKSLTRKDFRIRDPLWMR